MTAVIAKESRQKDPLLTDRIVKIVCLYAQRSVEELGKESVRLQDRLASLLGSAFLMTAVEAHCSLLPPTLPTVFVARCSLAPGTEHNSRL